MNINPKISAFAAGMCVLAFSAPSAVLAEEKTDKPAKEMTKGDQRLAKLLEGRIAGEPVSCIRHRTNDRLQVIDDTALVYGRGKTIYVNYTQRPDRIDDRDTLVTRRYGSQVCKTDIITTIDNLNGIYTGNVFLSEFIPYTRKKKDDS
ncbi:MAG: hypothetical protein ABJP34_04450 [Erythrobacter sp.]